MVRVAVDAHTTPASLASTLAFNTNAEPAEEDHELLVVRTSAVLLEKQALTDLVNDNDILEWRVIDDPSGENNTENVRTVAHSILTKQRRMRHPNKCIVHVGEKLRQRRLREQRRQTPLSRASFSLQETPRSTSRLQLRRSSSIRRESSLSRFLPRDFLLQAAFECLDHQRGIQSLCRRLLLRVRDLHVRLGMHPIEEIYPVVEALAIGTTELSTQREMSPSNTATSVRWLYPLVSRSVVHTDLPIVRQGYVTVVEWVALWRQQRSAYACLCDGAKLYFFLTKKQCDEYLLELTLRGDSCDPSTEPDHKRIIKENAPQSCIDLMENQWCVRKGEFSSEANGGAAPSIQKDSTPARHAFALFDNVGKLRLILDVTTATDAEKWVQAIKTETIRSERLASATVPARSLLRDHDGQCVLPLRWLHRYVDTMGGGNATQQRGKSVTLSQALKDARRDRLQINGVVYSGKCVEEIVGALLMEISHQCSTLTPMEALQFTRVLLIASSRTQGGGDILDALRVVVGSSDRYDFCPAASARVEPIQIEITADTSGTRVVANVSMRMSYSVHSRVFNDAAPVETTPVIALVGQYRRRLVCSAEEWNQLDGEVEIVHKNAA